MTTGEQGSPLIDSLSAELQSPGSFDEYVGKHGLDPTDPAPLRFIAGIWKVMLEVSKSARRLAKPLLTLN